MSMMGGGAAGPSALDQLAQMRQQPQPVGPNQGIGAPQLGAPAPAQPSGPTPAVDGHSLTNGNQQDVLAEMGQTATGGGDDTKLRQAVAELTGLFPKLKVTKHENGHAELTGPAQEQFLGAAYGRSKGAKVAHVRNNGRGQRLHLSF